MHSFDFQRLVEIAMTPAPHPPGFRAAVLAMSGHERLMLTEGIREAVFGPDYASRGVERRITIVGPDR